MRWFIQNFISVEFFTLFIILSICEYIQVLYRHNKASYYAQLWLYFAPWNETFFCKINFCCFSTVFVRCCFGENFVKYNIYLEKYCFAMFAFRTWVIFWSWQSWVSNNIGDNICQFVNFVHNFVDINAVIVGNLFVIAITAGIHQNFVFFVFFGIKHVIAFLKSKQNSKIKIKFVKFSLYSRQTLKNPLRFDDFLTENWKFQYWKKSWNFVYIWETIWRVFLTENSEL